MKHAILTLIATGCVAFSALAQAPPTVSEVFDRYERAIGGRTAFDRFTTRVSIGTYEVVTRALARPVEVYAKAPNKRVQIFGLGEAAQGFNGETGWQINVSENGLTELTGPGLANAKREAIFNGEVTLKELYARLTFDGTSKVGTRNAYVIQATSREGLAEKLFFDAQSGLLLRRVVGPTETEFSDYRDVDGVRLPFSIVRKLPGTTLSWKFREIRHNVEIDDAKFAVPTP